jgi:hypothetical protein
MNSIFINKEEYVLSDDLFIKAPIYCKESRNARELIRKNKITDFVFAKPDDKNNWSITNGKSYKYDKILIKKLFIDTIKELNDDKPGIKDNVESAPKIINLLDNEKFQDNDGNIIDIETRGERTVDKIYFKVKDVMKGFEINELNKTLISFNSVYKIDEHYKYFNCRKFVKNNNYTRSIKKELFLTYMGFLRLIHVSRNKIYKNNIYIMQKWLDNFDNTVLNNYKINIKDASIKNNIGYVYIVSSDLLNAVKIGMWRSNIESLYSRYITCYGSNLHIDYFLTSNARELEYNTHTYFKKNRITNELFDKKYYSNYINYIKNNIDFTNQLELENIFNNILSENNI